MPSKLPETGVGRQALERMLEEARQADRDMIHADWNARVFLYVFHASDEVREIAEAAYMQFLKTDVLGSSAYPSVTRFARELVGFTAHLLGGNDDTAGHVTTGGTESIILALKAARGWAREHRPTLECPEVVAARPAHPTFDKAAELLGMRIVRVPDDAGYRADVQAMAEAITDDTVMLVGSAPSYWHGVVDPIGALGELAQSHGLWLHVDACLGGYLAPFVRKLGYPVPDFDLSVPGVRSISADLHKYGFAPKGASVLLMRDAPDATHHVFDWQDRFIHYTTPGLSGTRSGAAIAAAWAGDAVPRRARLPGFRGCDHARATHASGRHPWNRWPPGTGRARVEHRQLRLGGGRDLRRCRGA